MHTGHPARPRSSRPSFAAELTDTTPSGVRELGSTGAEPRQPAEGAPAVEIREINSRDTAYLALLELAVADEDWEEEEATSVYSTAGSGADEGETAPPGAIEAMVDELFAVTIEDDWEDSGSTHQYEVEREPESGTQPRAERATWRVPTGWAPPPSWSVPSKAARAWAAHAARVTARAIAAPSSPSAPPAAAARPAASPLCLPPVVAGHAPARVAAPRSGPPGPPPPRQASLGEGTSRSSSGRLLPAPTCSSRLATAAPVGSRPSLLWSASLERSR
jgi:hypothetical protein